MKKKLPTLLRLETIFIFAYFVILLVERVIDVILSLTLTNHERNLNESMIYLLICVSILVFAFFSIMECRSFYKAVFRGWVSDYEKIDFKFVSIISGVLLLSGMTHTPITTLAAQFTSYGFLLIGILLHLIHTIKEEKIKGKKLGDYINRYVYFVMMSMSIPVIYYDVTLNGGEVAFNILQWVTMILLVGLFTCMMISFYKNDGKIMLNWQSLAVVLALDIPLLIVGWNSEHALPELADGFNFFLLVFPVLMIISYIVGILVFRDKENK